MKTLDAQVGCHLPPFSNIYRVPERWQMTTMPLSRYTPHEGNFGNLKFSSSNGPPSTAPCLASTQALRSHRVSSASDLLDVHGCHRSDRCSHRSDRFGAVVDPPSLRTWLSAQPRNLQWFCGEPLVKPRRRRSTSTPSFKPQVFRFRRTDRLLELALFLDLVAAIIPTR